MPVVTAKEQHETVQRKYKNRVLAALSKAELSRLERHLRPVTLKQGQTLSDGKVTHGYFLEQGIASVVVTLKHGDTVEVGMIGVDGVVGLPIVPDDGQCRSK